MGKSKKYPNQEVGGKSHNIPPLRLFYVSRGHGVLLVALTESHSGTHSIMQVMEKVGEITATAKKLHGVVGEAVSPQPWYRPCLDKAEVYGEGDKLTISTYVSFPLTHPSDEETLVREVEKFLGTYHYDRRKS
jgi:hypothetical protein